MRTIKYKAWNKTSHSMIEDYAGIGPFGELYTTTLDDIEVSNSYEKCPNLILLQYTGLKDKNGKEIYEGDIVAEEVIRLPHSLFINKKVTFFSGMFTDGTNPLSRTPAACLEVIGNIYEKQYQELLKSVGSYDKKNGQ